MMQYVLRMLTIGLIHGDLSEFNVLVDEDGPVIIDLPQAVDAAGNNNAQAMLARDVRNITEYYGQFAPELLETHYAEELWALFEEGALRPDYPLTGYFEVDEHSADTDAVMAEIRAVLAEEESRQRRIRAAETGEEPEGPEDEAPN
jgi:RIO kinase 1